MILKRRGSKDVQRRKNLRSQSKIVTMTRKPIITVMEKPLLILQRIIQRSRRFESPITFMSEHAVAKPLIATAWPKE